MEPVRLDVAVVGAGFAGLYLLHKLRGQGLRVRVYEAAPDIGGTWYWNRYPGARCDVESMQYSYSFDEDLQQEWNWTERFATQPEILRYINHVADRFDLRCDIHLDTRIATARWDEGAGLWRLETARGERIEASFCIMATGCLSASRLPDIPGIDSFGGETYHTGQWPHHPVDLAGKRVAVIGTGSSGIQAIPELARLSGQLTVFQRTPTFTVPARNAALSAETVAEWKDSYCERRHYARTATPTGTIYDFATCSALAVDDAAREATYAARWQKGGANFMHAYNDLLLDERANDTAAEFVRARIRETVKDPDLARRLSPTGFPIGTKRICVDTDYYATYNRDNVTLVDLRDTPIEAIVPEGVRTTGGVREFDVIVFATGFDALTGALSRIDIRGMKGLALTEKWAAGPRNYLGLMSAGFPNLFTVTGPLSPSVLSNVIVSIEQHVEWIAACLAWLRERGITRIEADRAAEDAWVDHVREVAAATLYLKANSWYLGANVPGKPRVFMPYIGVSRYRQTCDDVAARGYAGFVLSQPAEAS